MAGPTLLIERTSGQPQTRKLSSTYFETAGLRTLYSPGAGVSAVVKKIFIVRALATNEVFSLSHTLDGKSLTTSDLLYWRATATAMNIVIEPELYMNNGDVLEMESWTANVFLVSLFGEEVLIKAR